MKSKREIRARIFEVFSKNLEIIKSHPSVEIVPDFSEGVLAPEIAGQKNKNRLEENS
jgi:hypothetical protein